MIKSNQQVIETYEKSLNAGGADEMERFEELLRREEEKFSSKREERRKESRTPVLPKSYTDNIERYRTSPYLTKIADMNVFKR